MGVFLQGISGCAWHTELNLPKEKGAVVLNWRNIWMRMSIHSQATWLCCTWTFLFTVFVTWDCSKDWTHNAMRICENTQYTVLTEWNCEILALDSCLDPTGKRYCQGLGLDPWGCGLSVVPEFLFFMLHSIFHIYNTWHWRAVFVKVIWVSRGITA